MSLLKRMKEDIAKSGGNKGKLFFVKADSKRRVRFLTDFEEGIELVFHDNYTLGINSICAKELGEEHCEHCGNNDLRTRKLYGWPVFDYDANEVKILLYAVNNFTPIPALISMYEIYGTIIDRDYVIERKGSGQSTTYSVVPMDKAKFRSKVKVPTKSTMIKIVGKAFPPDAEIKDSDDYKNYEDDDNEEIDYEDMSARELYNLCKERGLDPQTKKSKEYYIELLEEMDEDEELWDEDDEW